MNDIVGIITAIVGLLVVIGGGFKYTFVVFNRRQTALEKQVADANKEAQERCHSQVSDLTERVRDLENARHRESRDDKDRVMTLAETMGKALENIAARLPTSETTPPGGNRSQG